jgi:hypothetical protein
MNRRELKLIANGMARNWLQWMLNFDEIDKSCEELNLSLSQEENLYIEQVILNIIEKLRQK